MGITQPQPNLGAHHSAAGCRRAPHHLHSAAQRKPSCLGAALLLCSASSWLADYIAQTPLLLDELLDTQSLYRLPSKAELLSELQQRLLRIDEQDLEHQMEVLRQFARAQAAHRRLRSDAKTAADENQRLPHLDGRSHCRNGDAAGVAAQRQQIRLSTNAAQEPVLSPELVVVAYGKLGGLELNYSSDLDLVLLHNSYAKATPQASAAKTTARLRTHGAAHDSYFDHSDSVW